MHANGHDLRRLLLRVSGGINMDSVGLSSFRTRILRVCHLLLVLSAAASAAADNKPVDKVKATDLLPTSNPFTDEELARGFVNQRITPYGNKSLYFEIPVSKEWDSRRLEAEIDPSQEDKALVELARLTPNSDDEGVAIEVRYSRVPERVTLPQFVETYAKAAGFTIVARARGEYNARQIEEAVLRLPTKDFGPMLIRFTASRHGERIFVVAGSAPEKKYDKYKKVFAIAAIGFSPGLKPK